MLVSLFKRRKKCLHKKLTPFSTGGFCPDCGKEIEISWLILRCKCCNSKRISRVFFDSIVPADKYCVKCGTSTCYVEQKEILEFFDYEYAIISKKEADNNLNIREVLQIWIEKDNNGSGVLNNIKLIPLLIK